MDPTPDLSARPSASPRPLLTAAGVTGVLLAIATLCPLSYQINDDIVITGLLKGLFGLPAGGDGIFLSRPLSWLLSGAYRAVPALPWYSLLLFAGLSLAVFSLAVTVSRSLPGAACRTAGLLLIASFAFLVAVQITFTSVSLMLWVSGTLQLALAPARERQPDGWHWLAAGQLAGAYLLRPDSLPILALLALPALLALLLESTPRLTLLLLLPLLLAASAEYAGTVLMDQDGMGREYREFNQARSAFIDTYRSLPTDRTPQALAAVGWSQQDYTVALNWWFHDSRAFSTDSLRTFLAANSDRHDLVDAGNFRINFYKNIYAALLLFAWLGVLMLVAARTGALTERKVIVPGLVLLMIAGLMFIRFPARVAQPTFLLGALLLLTAPFHEKRETRTGWLGAASLLFCGLLGAVNVAEGARLVEVNAIRGRNREYVAATVAEVVRKNGPGTLLVEVNPHLLPASHAPFREDDPALAVPVLTGGFLVGTQAYRALLARNGLGDRTTVVPAMIDNPRVVLRFWDSQRLPFDSYVQGVFLQHLRQRYGALRPGYTISARIVQDSRRSGVGPIYFQLVALPVTPGN